MARLNVSIPDALYSRLDRLRDRVNASKVCASAIEKELDMVEGAATSTADPSLVNRLVERLQQQQSERDRWYQRGWQDGEQWVLETASPNELESVADRWSWVDDDPAVLDDSRQQVHWRHSMPASFQVGLEMLKEEVDPPLKGAYIEGWYRSVQSLWTAAKPRVQSSQPPSQPAAEPPPVPPTPGY